MMTGASIALSMVLLLMVVAAFGYRSMRLPLACKLDELWRGDACLARLSAEELATVQALRALGFELRGGVSVRPPLAAKFAFMQRKDGAWAELQLDGRAGSLSLYCRDASTTLGVHESDWAFRAFGWLFPEPPERRQRLVSRGTSLARRLAMLDACSKARSKAPPNLDAHAEQLLARHEERMAERRAERTWIVEDGQAHPTWAGAVRMGVTVPFVLLCKLIPNGKRPTS